MKQIELDSSRFKKWFSYPIDMNTPATTDVPRAVSPQAIGAPLARRIAAVETREAHVSTAQIAAPPRVSAAGR